jgi:hypothetical protein
VRGKELKVRLVGLVWGTVGKRRSDNAFRNAVTAIEARTSGQERRSPRDRFGIQGSRWGALTPSPARVWMDMPTMIMHGAADSVVPV